ncbi:hypothetical protein V500_06736 [Pseudogymnoascus sp. VKM F-4518 (FW-2643)]|nr:hypothetical protein V500_06736 [Pseudogymnoascus sp. VKM F-4518 (FW-2643)]
MSTLTEADIIVLKNLRYDIQNDIQDSSTAAAAARPNRPKSDDDDDSVRPILEELSRESTAFTTWDNNEINPTLDRLVVQPYLAWASKLVRQDPDTVFITHIIVHFTTLLPSALCLYYSFSWLHAVLHTVYAVWNAGPFTLLLHNHIHNNGLLGKQYAFFDRLFPYVTGPLMGHTWDSYYYHHVKMHHVEGNGPGDLSSTIYFQRDEPLEFIRYFVRFLIFTWLELPIYFFRNKKYDLAAKALISECSSMGFIYLAAQLNTRPTVFVLILPFFIMRLGMMIGNFGQHCLVDNVDPMSDYRSSITLIDVPSNRHCFNDGYHTSHHLNPRRHWKAHPAAFLKAKPNYQAEGALTFTDIDYLMITYRCITKDFDYLARRLVPMGAQIGMTHEERVEMLRSKTRRFTPEEIRLKFMKKGGRASAAAVAAVPVPVVGVADGRVKGKLGRSRRESVTAAAVKAGASIGEGSGRVVNHELVSHRL